MSNSLAQPDYIEISKALADSDSTFEAAEAHGLLCGIICATAGETSQWDELIVGDSKDPHVKLLLQELYESSYHQITDFSFEFIILLPDESIDINVRTETLGLWCQGFLTGLQQSKTPVDAHPSPEVQEGLDDLVEIAQVSFGDLRDNDEDETAYYELVEHVRMMVLMLFQELKDIPQSEDEEENFEDRGDEDFEND